MPLQLLRHVKALSLSTLTPNQVNYLNIGLMIVAALAAFMRPFELFLFAYAFFGPLHYLTEISWLHDRNYFTRGKNDYLVLVAIAGIIAVSDLQIIPGIALQLGVAVTYIAFGSALVFVLVNNLKLRVACFAALVATSFVVVRIDFFQSIFSLLLPTIIHVFVFTGLFILVGAMKGRSASGIASLAVFCLCALSFFVLAPISSGGDVDRYVRQAYQQFAQLNYSLMTPFNQHDLNVPANVIEYARYVNTVLYQSPTALAIMGFISFAYFYHYLNWFSKTSIIQWHNIPRSRFIGIIVIWVASVGAYLYDYRLGMRWLYFMAFTHVLLEFPLNHISIITIGKELQTMAGLRAPTRGTVKA